MKRKIGFASATFALAMVIMGCQCPHDWEDARIITEPTCTKKGAKIVKCFDCGEERTEEIAAKGHSYNWITTDSSIHWKECTGCGSKIEGTSAHRFTLVTTDPEKHWKECKCGRKIEESNHSFGDWIITDDKHWKECSECGKKIDESVHEYICKNNGWQRCKDCNKESTIPVSLDTLGTYDSERMTFGVYPQTIKAGDVTVNKTIKNTEITGADYYLGSDGAWYAECVENSCGTENKYSDGSKVAQKSANNSKKYFKVKPIEWVYLESTKCLHAKKILTADVQWHESSNNYKNSNIRSWLNGTFYDSAFTENQKKKIKTTTVDNSAASTTDARNNLRQATSYACEDTQDKIFLLSEKEATTSGNGFPAYDKHDAGNSRLRSPTDYALANYYEWGWWLRSPDSSDSFSVRTIWVAGSADRSYRVLSSSFGVVPALSISE